ncbi:MAG: phosphodiester glycosidase family protein [Anaerolineae bacterium]|nr:phosphodiester glycosidase family protein [Anaerolineae bacterium]
MRLSLLLLISLIFACNLATPPTTVVPTAATPSMTATPDGWETIANGIQQRWVVTDEGFAYETIRIDPTQYTFRVHYREGDALTIREWRDELTGAMVIINANFYTPENIILGLLISDGFAYGRAYSDRGGTFFVQNGSVGIRWNTQQPYQGEAYEQAIQAFPMLVYNGQAVYNNRNDTTPSRRTVIGIDAQGRVIMMVTPGFGSSLYALSQYLVTTDIGFVHAFNLDGGGSTMMLRSVDNYMLTSLDPVPAVLALYAQP